MIWLIQLIIILLSILMCVAFFTLLERVFMGVSQRRRGPNKISVWGIFQPILDGLKLMSKAAFKPMSINNLMFSLIPSINLMIFILFWTSLPLKTNLINFQMNSLFVIILLGMMGFGVLLSGWASNSKYALYGSLRSMTQSISYEICLSLVLLMVLNLKDSFNLMNLNNGFLSIETMFGLFLLIPTLLMILAECGRTPFDLLEAESELVSGFNIEFGSVEFAFLSMSEYGIMIVLGLMFSLILTPYISIITTSFFIISILFTRYTFPRIRYDFLMSFMWKSLLPFTILMWITIHNLKMI